MTKDFNRLRGWLDLEGVAILRDDSLARTDCNVCDDVEKLLVVSLAQESMCFFRGDVSEKEQAGVIANSLPIELIIDPERARPYLSGIVEIRQETSYYF